MNDPLAAEKGKSSPRIALLTGGGDRPYALGLTTTLSEHGISVDFIGSDELDLPELRCIPSVNFLNLRGDQRSNVNPWRKATRILTYYSRLLHYAITSRARLFHILWNNKFEVVDRTILILCYKLFGRRVVFTAHNVNAGARDGTDGVLNRLTLRAQYHLVDHIFVHTAMMKEQLVEQFSVPGSKVSVLPLGVNNTVPTTNLSVDEARQHMGIAKGEKVLLFYGRIAPYKGLEYLITALARLSNIGGKYRLVIAGSVKDCAEYWHSIQREISTHCLRDCIVERIEFIPDEETEWYFKAADVLVMPYTEVFQSGVLMLAYSFGLPVIAADVGSLREDVVEGETGYIFRPKDPADLAKAIEVYFSSALFKELERRRQEIRDYANERYSWDKVGEITTRVYAELLGRTVGSGVIHTQNQKNL